MDCPLKALSRAVRRQMGAVSIEVLAQQPRIFQRLHKIYRYSLMPKRDRQILFSNLIEHGAEIGSSLRCKHLSTRS